MATVVVKSIGLPGNGRDYTSLQSWEDACPANLITADQVWKGECYNDGGPFTANGNNLMISGITADATRYVWLTTATGQSFRDHANVLTNPLRYDETKGVAVTHTAPIRQWVIAVNVPYTLIENLQIQACPDSYAGSTTLYIDQAYDGSGHHVTAKNCIIEQNPSCGTTGHGAASPLQSADTVNDTQLIINCVIIQRSNTPNGANCVAGFGDSGGTLINCTLVMTGLNATPATALSGRRYNGGNASTINCAAFGFQTLQSGTGGTHTNGMCDTTTGVPSGWTSGKVFANQFSNIIDATRDFRLKAGADLIGAGTTDSRATPDIAKTARPQGTGYDIGAWEFAAAGGFRSRIAGGRVQ